MSDSSSSKAAAEALRTLYSANDMFTHDTKGETLAPVEKYPTKFAPEKFSKTLSRSDHFKLKNLPIKRPRADQSQVYDLWAEENELGLSLTNDKNKSHIPAVISPHPGQSYRPDKVYHDDILDTVVVEELVKEEDNQKREEVLNSFRVIEEDVDVQESEDDEPAEFIKNPRVVEKHFTNTQKNIRIRNKLKEKLKKIMAKEKKTQKQLDKIPQIIKSLDSLDKNYKALREEEKNYKKLKIELEKTGEIVPRIRMGKFRYKKPETAANIEPSEALRKINNKANNVEERMDSFIRRKMVDLYKGNQKKFVVIKDCYNTDQERHEERLKEALKKEKEKETGNISLS